MRKRRDPFWSILVLVLWLVLTFVGCLRGVAVEPAEAIRALETHGFSEVRITDKSVIMPGLRGCDRGDAALFRARARNPAGNEVEVIVCVGWPFKGSTVRVP